jgi:hypothetical protein
MTATHQSAHLDRLAARLYERRDEGVMLNWAAVSIGDWHPQHNVCHENVTTWCQNQPNHHVVRGWFYFAFEDLQPYVQFTAHSAVRIENGELYDITPSNASQQYPFIVAEETEEAYAALVEGQRVTQLVHMK